MRKIFGAVLVCFFLLALSGCGCSHEWTEADCAAPKTCSLCGETEGEPISHSWQDADCENPQICTLCGETQGEALGHNWQEATCTLAAVCSRCDGSQGEPLPHTLGALQKAGDTMFRTCQVCGWEESVPFAADVYLQEKLVGSWICRSVSQDSINGSYHKEYIRDTLDPDAVTFRGDGTFTATLGEYKTGTWAYRETIESNGYLNYYCDLHYDGDREDVIHSIRYSDDFGVSIMETDRGMVTSYNFLAPTPEMEAAAAHMYGTWYSTMYITYELDRSSSIYEKDTVTFDLDHSITFLEDGTLTAQFLGEKTGIWFCSNIYESQYNTLYSYQLQFDGESQVYDAIYSVHTNPSVINQGLDLGMDKDNKPVSYIFYQMTEAECLEFAKAPELLPGSWVSASAEYWSADAEEPQKEETDKYYLTFQADGTFWGALQTDCRGKWVIDSYDPETGVYSYEILTPDNHYYFLELRPDGTLSVLLPVEDGSVDILMKKQ